MIDVLNPNYHGILSIIKGIRNGLVYGSKVRFPHALVMTLLYKSGKPTVLIESILKATWQHAKNLGSFVGLYKAVMYLLRRLNEDKIAQIHPFLAGTLAGGIVFGKEDNINLQINLYLLSRLMMASTKFAASKGFIPTIPANTSFSIFGALVWGFIMFMFKNQPQFLQPSLLSSMEYLYNDSEKWKNLWTIFIHNN